MTDELLYAKLARHTAETGSPLPVLHGDHVGFLGVVYPTRALTVLRCVRRAGGVRRHTRRQRGALRERRDPRVPAHPPSRAGLRARSSCRCCPWPCRGASTRRSSCRRPRRIPCSSGRSSRATLRSPSRLRAETPLRSEPWRSRSSRGRSSSCSPRSCPLAALIADGPRGRLEAASAARGRLRGGDPHRRPARRARREPPAPRRLRGDGDAGIAAPRDRLEVRGDPPRRARRRPRRGAVPPRRRLGVLAAPRCRPAAALVRPAHRAVAAAARARDGLVRRALRRFGRRARPLPVLPRAAPPAGDRALPDGRPPPAPRDRRSDGVLHRDRLLRRLRDRSRACGSTRPSRY